MLCLISVNQQYYYKAESLRGRIYMRCRVKCVTNSIMKTLCFSLGLLLLLAFCGCDVLDQQHDDGPPASCCFKFFDRHLPTRHVADIEKIPSTCPAPGFIVTTIRGRKICFRQNTEWVQKYINRVHGTEGDGI